MSACRALRSCPSLVRLRLHREGSSPAARALETPPPVPAARPGRRSGAPGWREILLAALLALALAAWPLRAGLFHQDRVLFGVDTATVHRPWSDAIAAQGGGDAPRPRNPAISDQGHVFYPFYLWVAKSWLAGDPPAWNPKLYAGVPGIGNPQSGALDPQVLPLVLLHALGGREAFDRGLAWMAWLRVAAAGLGAYLLARALGLARLPAAFSGVAFALSGYVLLWLNFSLGHVTPLLPWVLYGLEGLRGERPLRAAAGTSLALAAAILGGHPETAFYVGAVAGVFALALLFEDRRAGALGLIALGLGTATAAASILTFVEYLELSGAKAIRDALLAPSGVDLFALGAVLVALGLAAWFARLTQAAAEPARLGRDAAVAAVGLALGLGGMALLIRRRGLGEGAPLLLVPDLYGAPGMAGGYRGGGTYVESASAWIALAALGLALAAALSARGVLRRRRVVIACGLAALLLALELPGVLDLYRHAPLVGLGATERFASVSALMLALLAGEALQAAPRAARLAAALTLAVLGGGALWREAPVPLPPELIPVVQEDELFGLVVAPAAELTAESLMLEGWLHPELPITRGSLTVQRLDGAGRPDPGACFSAPLDLFDAPTPAARAAAPERAARAPAGARFFRPSYVAFSWLEPGVWRFAVDFFTDASGETPVATRVVAVSRVERPRGVERSTLALGAAALLLIALLPARPGPRWQLALLGVALAQGLCFARGLNPAVPRAECFPATRTEEILAEILGPYRFFSDPMVMPPDTGLVRDLAALDGYDGMDVANFNRYRSLCLPPGTNALLGWHARGVLLDSPAFRLLGVGALVLASPLSAPGWELVAGPGAEREAETWIYRATDPMPRAFCVPRVVGFDELGALLDAGEWDPATTACSDAAWRPGVPFTHSVVSTPRWTNNTVQLEAELDGDGLLVLTEQAFPGWKVLVDGEERPLVTADAIFRGVALGAGRHSVEFRYAPWSLRWGAGISGVGLVVTLCFLVVGFRRVRAG